MANDGDVAVERHQAEAARLRSEIEQLVRQAHVLLHGDIQGKPPSSKPPTAKRAEREKELEVSLEKADWFRREIKRLKAELESRDQLIGGPHVVLEKDPMELQNLIVEKRRELQRLQRAGEGLDRVAEAQKRADEQQRALRPDVEARLNHFKKEVEAQKRKNVKLQADRLKLSNARKAAEEEVRVAGSQLRSKAALLHQGPPKPATSYSDEEAKAIKLLRRDIDILRVAVQQDERKYKVAEKEDEQELKFAQDHVVSLKASMEEKGTELDRLKAELDRVKPANRPQRPEDLLPKLPSSSGMVPASTPVSPKEEAGSSNFEMGHSSPIPESDERLPESDERLPESDSPPPEADDEAVAADAAE